MAPLPIGSTILISGAGIIGNLWASILHHSGHRKVIIAEPVLARRELTQKLGTYKSYISIAFKQYILAWCISRNRCIHAHREHTHMHVCMCV